MAATPLAPPQLNPAQYAPHAQFSPSPTEEIKQKVLSTGASKALSKAGEALFPGAVAPAAGGTAAAPSGLAGLLPTGLTSLFGAAPAAATGAATTGAAGAGLAGGALAGGAGLMAAAAPIALPLAAGALAGKAFGLFNEGGRVPSETMTAMPRAQQSPQYMTQQSPQHMAQQSPQYMTQQSPQHMAQRSPYPMPQRSPQNMPMHASPQMAQQPAPSQMMQRPQPPLSFKQLEQQQSLSLNKQAFDADERRKNQSHQMKMMQEEIKLRDAAGFRTPLSAP